MTTLIQPVTTRHEGHAVSPIRLWTWAAPTLAGEPSRPLWCSRCITRWPDVHALEETGNEVLGYAERALWKRVAFTSPHPERWLRGRIAAKHAVHHLLRNALGLSLPPTSIAVLPGAAGQPVVYVPLPSDVFVAPVVSISHCGDTAVALAGLRAGALEPGVGIDIASPADDHEGLAEGGFAENEVALLASLPLEDRPLWLLRLWCAKEAVGKALETGLMGDPLRLQVRQIDFYRQRVTIELPPGTPLAAGGSRTFAARVGVDSGLAFGVAGMG